MSIAGAILVTVLNISQEAMQSRWNVSVYYLVVSSHGVGAFFEVFSVLAVLPFALSIGKTAEMAILDALRHA